MNTEAEGRGAAQRFRTQHSLGLQPLGDLVTVIEQTVNADVAVLDTDVGQHGMTMRRVDRDEIYIGVARTRSPMRQRSTLAHELAHIEFGDWDDQPQRNCAEPVESRANAFARHLLLPLGGLEQLLATTNCRDTFATLSNVVQRFLVSPSIAAIQFEHIGLINQDIKEKWISEISTRRLAVQFGWLDQYRALQNESDTRRAPQKLLTRAISGWMNNIASDQLIATLLGREADSVQRELLAAGLKPAEVTPIWDTLAGPIGSDINLAELDADLADDGGCE